MMRASEKDRRGGLPPRGPTTIAVAAEGDGFGLGIQVFKIDSQALRADKKDKRLFMQNVENPAFARKYEKPVIDTPDRSAQESRVNRLKKISALLPEASKTEKSSADAIEATTYSKPNLSIARRSGTTEKTPHPSTTNVKQLAPTDMQKGKKTAPNPPQLGLKRPPNVEQKHPELIVTFPALENEQLRKFEDLQKEAEQKRRDTRRKLKKMRQEAPPEQQHRLQLQLEALDSRSLIEQIVEQQKLDGYQQGNSEDECQLVAYVRGDLNKPPEDDYVEVRQVWAGFVNNVQHRQRGEQQLSEPEVVNPAKVDQ